jgi:hypothetical protein
MKTLILCVLIVLRNPPVTAQSWSPQLGIEAGFHRLKPAGTNSPDHVDRWELPNSGSVLPSVFVVVPLSGRIALESGLAVLRTEFKEAAELIASTRAADVRLAIRADVALSSGVYFAAGGTIRFRQIEDNHSVQTGLLAAVGYQRSVSSSLSARIETQWRAQRKTDSLAPSNVYALLIGLSRRLNTVDARAEAGRGDRTFRAWRLQLGTAGGYARTHLYGSVLGLYLDARETAITLPGSGATTPPPLYLIAPLRGRLALEVGLGAARTRRQDSTLFDSHLATRLNVAITRGAYAGAGGNIRYLAQTSSKGFAFAGVNLGAGYRFSLINALEGRVDVSYATFKERENFPFAQNNVAVLLGVAMALE